jgi:hypothetical protein
MGVIVSKSVAIGASGGTPGISQGASCSAALTRPADSGWNMQPKDHWWWLV